MVSKVNKIKRLLKLADFIDKLPRKAFNLGILASKTSCGTTCCLMGWAGMMPTFRRLGYRTNFDVFGELSSKGVEYGDGNYESIGDYSGAANLFGLLWEESIGLFKSTNPYNYYPTDRPTPKKAAKVLRAFVARKLKELGVSK